MNEQVQELLAKEIVRYGVIDHGVFCLFAVAIAYFGWTGIRHAIKKFDEADDKDVSSGDCFIFILGVVLVGIGVWGSITSALLVIQALVAPHLYVIEQNAKLL